MPRTFTPTELHTIHNTDFFSVKASATKKIEHLFADVRDAIKDAIENKNIAFPTEVDSVNGKIFRGENYLGLPYLVLDYPKHFSKDSVLAFRTMFWWGKFFSFTLHLQGKALKEYRNHFLPELLALKKNRKGLGNEIYICVNNSPWHYHYKKDNYLPVSKLSEPALRKLLLKKEFVKLSMRIPLKDYKKLVPFALENFLHLYPPHPCESSVA